MTKRDLVEFGIPESDIAVVPNGITYDEFAGSEPAESEFDVVFVGGLVKERNIDVLLRAIAQLDDVTVADHGDGPERESLRALAADFDRDAITADAERCYQPVATDGRVRTDHSTSLPKTEG